MEGVAWIAVCQFDGWVEDGFVLDWIIDIYMNRPTGNSSSWLSYYTNATGTNENGTISSFTMDLVEPNVALMHDRIDFDVSDLSLEKDSSPEMLEASPRMLEALLEMLVELSEMLQASPGMLQASPGMLQASTGILEASLGMLVASPVMLVASPGMRLSAPGMLVALPGMLLAKNGKSISASTGRQ
ncbi:unnamed protein product [Rotaria sordida]|uniref:Uncharacterized protein n=1 Tax=Rotaria sordida TaxID=392033 RepID=A0A814LV08_9BILA|nr:unnamed protein product [Rotaria sordida]